MSLLELVVRIFAYNAMIFGNGPVMIPMLQRDLVDERGLLTTDQLLYAFTLARVTPGQANTYVASVGYMLYGIVGAVLTTLAIQLPGYLMIPLMHSYERFKSSQVTKHFTRGLTATSVGLIFAATLSIARKSLVGPIAWIVFAITLAFTYLLKWNPILSLIAASAIGIALKLALPLVAPGVAW